MAGAVTLPARAALMALRRRYETELFESVVPFWVRHSPDRVHGGYWNCLDRDGSVYDRTKYGWLHGRQVWMLAKLYGTVEARPEWLELALSGARFLGERCLLPGGRLPFSMTADGRAVYVQLKIFTECFCVMALAELARATGEARYAREAEQEFERVWDWAFDWTKVGRPSFPGETPKRSLAVPMILLNLLEELTGGNAQERMGQVEECLRLVRLHVRPEERLVLEHVDPDGGTLDSAEGRLLNPGHAIEAGWFLQHWARRLGRADLSREAVDVVRWSFARGWAAEHGGLLYFLDAEGPSPLPLEWSMKLWWPHAEALYAHLLDYS
ncbi:MAG: N-acylglucosamine 2-epimerase, partial [Gemmatimonadetes bacterium]|nr:N-acylglucosamine 2-epimerase [Gemmatimonadota bacterium]